MSKPDKKSTTVVTSVKYPVRVSYANLMTAVEVTKGGKTFMEYNTMLLIPKEDKQTIAAINSAIELVGQAHFGNNRPPGLKITFRDGDIAGGAAAGGVSASVTAGSEPYGGHMFMSVSSKVKPDVRGPNMEELIDPGDIQSGDYVRVSVNCYAWGPTKNGSGISFGLGNVQFLKKGVPLDSRTSAEDDFDPIEVPEGAADVKGGIFT